MGKDLVYTAPYLVFKYGGVAQLVRASACHAEGRGFESRHSRHPPSRVSALRRDATPKLEHSESEGGLLVQSLNLAPYISFIPYKALLPQNITT